MSRSMHILTRAVVATIAMSVIPVGPIVAQSPPPSSAPTPSLAPSSLFPPMQFAGGDASQLVFTSTCGVWGRDPISLHGEGGAGSADLVVTFSDYDTEAAQIPASACATGSPSPS